MTTPNSASGAPDPSLPAGFKITRLRPAGPKRGQSTASFLRGKAMGDRQWDKTREANFQRLQQPKPKRRRIQWPPLQPPQC
jgi:hypothetical protein